jgi:signal transduction histidine kinase
VTKEILSELEERDVLSANVSLKDIMTRFKVYRPMQQKVANLATRATLLYKKDSLDVEDLQAQQRDLRKFVTDMLSWGILANFSVGMIMLWSFSRHFKNRVNLLVADAGRLGDNKPIDKLIAGTDELAYLDLIFHHTQEQLINAATERAAMMSMLAKEMAEPLKEAQRSLSALEEREKSKLSEKQLKQLTRAQLNINRVLALVDDLLTMETLETGKITLEPTTFNLQSLADESIATVASLAAAKQINLGSQCADVVLFADKARLIQTLINFLSNAVKFSPEKSSITILGAAKSDAFRISVKDEGPGMDEHTKNHVFEKFFQAEGEKKQQGFGLGLAICRMIVESHGGTIGVESAPGEGSTFWFDLPLSRLHDS